MDRRILPLGLFALLVGCGAEHQHPKRPEAALKPLPVRVATAQEISQPVGDEVVGTVRARSVSAISSSVMGNIRALKVTLGSRVRAGDVLIQLSAGEIEAKANQAKASFAQAETDLKRAEQLKASQSIPAAQYDSAKAQFHFAQAGLAEAEVMRGYTVIRAPFAGVITAKECAVGDLALPGKPLLVLESPGALRLEASVPEAIAHSLHSGASMAVRIDALQREVSATVSELSPSSDPVSRTVLVKLDLPSLPELRPGMFGRLVVPTGEEKAVVVPASAILRRGQMETVFVVDHDQAHLRLVRSGRSHDGQTEVLAGLDQGEAVVVADVNQLVDSQPVKVQP